MKVPFVDLKAQYHSIKPEIDAAIFSVIEEGSFIGGKHVKQFEEDFSTYLGIKHVIACANGTDSLEIIMKAMGIGAGDEVIVPALSWFSTSESVSAVGAKPVFVDIEKDFYTINTELIEAKINSRTKAIIPVHLYGQAADMPKIMALASKHNLKVIEDCAQSHGAEIDGKKAGTWGHASSFSFYPGKNLGAYGDAGCMCTADDELALLCRMIANHGQLKKHDHVMEGRNSRLDGLHAAVLSVKLKYLVRWTEARIKHAELYNGLLENSLISVPKNRHNGKHVYHLYVVQMEDREAMMKKLEEKGIQSAVHYPSALPLLKAYKNCDYSANDFPIAAKASSRILSLPMFAELDENTIQYIVSVLKEK